MTRSGIDLHTFGPGGVSILECYPLDDVAASTRALIVEAARAKDRLDRLAAVTTGEAEAFFEVVDVNDKKVAVTVDGLVSEQRQLTTVFRQTLADIEKRVGNTSVIDGEEVEFANI